LNTIINAKKRTSLLWDNMIVLDKIEKLTSKVEDLNESVRILCELLALVLKVKINWESDKEEEEDKEEEDEEYNQTT